MKRLLLACLILAGCGHKSVDTTFYLPDAVQGSQPFCVSNRSLGDVRIPHGPTIHSGQMVNAAVVQDFQWGFDTPKPATDRQDVDCFVVE